MAAKLVDDGVRPQGWHILPNEIKAMIIEHWLKDHLETIRKA